MDHPPPPSTPSSGPPATPRPEPPGGLLADAGERLARWRDDPRVAVVVVLLLVVGLGAFWYRSAVASRGGGEAAPAPTSPSAPAVTTTTTTAPPVVVVHVAGAVVTPGVVSLPGDARVVDAIDAAGGPVADADLDRLNLAAPLTDGVRILVARVGDPPTPVEPSGSAVATTGGPTAEAPLDLNAATAEQLEDLPGIGPALAAAIVEERDRRGGFTDVAQLEDVPGIGEKRFADLRDLVTV